MHGDNGVYAVDGLLPEVGSFINRDLRSFRAIEPGITAGLAGDILATFITLESSLALRWLRPHQYFVAAFRIAAATGLPVFQAIGIAAAEGLGVPLVTASPDVAVRVQEFRSRGL